MRDVEVILSQVLTANEVKSILESSADNLGDIAWDLYYGHGRVNANGVVQMAMTGSSGGGGG